MATILTGKTAYGEDKVLYAVRDALAHYEQKHPAASAELYRYSPASIRVRVVDPGFDGLSIKPRDRRVAEVIEPLLDDDVMGTITQLLCVTPKEMAGLDFLSHEFDHPTPSFATAATP